jgi:hypothetical protein
MNGSAWTPLYGLGKQTKHAVTRLRGTTPNLPTNRTQLYSKLPRLVPPRLQCAAWPGARHRYRPPLLMLARASCIADRDYAQGFLPNGHGDVMSDSSIAMPFLDGRPHPPWPCHAHALCCHPSGLAASLPAISEKSQPHFTFCLPTPSFFSQLLLPNNSSLIINYTITVRLLRPSSS